MNPANIKDNIFTIKKLSHNNDYYSNVFKKTESLISVIFYILSFVERTPRSQVHVENLTARGLALYETVLASLQVPEFEASARLVELQQELLGLRGSIMMAESAGVITVELVGALDEPIDLAMRYLRNHFFTQSVTDPQNSVVRDAPTVPPKMPRPRKETRVAIPKGDISSDAHLVYSQLTDRSERIKTVLDAKPAATIKDIAEVITDVSEKTIQRELNSLIEKGQVVRDGERRWSKYSILK